MKVIILGGSPASGKTTLAEKLLGAIGHGEKFRAHEQISGSFHKSHKCFVLGVYSSDRALRGTDALEMTAHARGHGGPEFFETVSKFYPDHTVFMEGERFLKRPFIKFLHELGAELKIIFLRLDEGELAKCQEKRVADGIQTWHTLKRRNTFYRNFAREYNPIELPNNTDVDRSRNLAILREHLAIPGQP